MNQWLTWLAEANARRAAAPKDLFDWSLPTDAAPELQTQWSRRWDLAEAPIVWGCACLLSTELVEEVGVEGWATIIYGPDPLLNADPGPLDYMANRVSDLWKSDRRPPFLLGLHHMLRASRPYGAHPLPEAIAGAYSAFVCRTYLRVAELPHRRARFDIIPVLALPEPESPIRVLPGALWPEEMQTLWGKDA